MGYGLCRRPPPLLIALGLQLLGISASRSWHFLVRKPVIWHAWWLHFGVLAEPGTILGHWGAQQRTLSGQGLDFYRFLADLGKPF